MEWQSKLDRGDRIEKKIETIKLDAGRRWTWWPFFVKAQGHRHNRREADRFVGERTCYCSDLLCTDRLSPQQPGPPTELNYSTAHNITSFIRELNVTLLEMGHTHAQSCNTYSCISRTKILSGKYTWAWTLIHPPSRTLSVCWQTLLWGKLAGIAERLRQAVKKPLRHKATHTHTDTNLRRRRDGTCSYCQITSLLALAPNYAIKVPQWGETA